VEPRHDRRLELRVESNAVAFAAPDAVGDVAVQLEAKWKTLREREREREKVR
jgi:hypothetical protein